MLSKTRGLGEFDEETSIRGGHSVLDEGPRGTGDPCSVDEKAGVDGRLAFEEVVVELVGVGG
jgi:hypothetical protein